MDERVSIVVPVYNDQIHLQNSITDLVNQDYKNIEIIIVDDGSTDTSGEVAISAARQDSRITVFHKQNGGTGSALNLGFSHVSSKYATWASSDDRKCPQYVSRLLQGLLSNDCVGMCFSAYYHQGAKKNIHMPAGSYDEFGIVKYYLRMSCKTYVSGVCFMYNMLYKNMVGNFSETAGEDYLMAVQLAAVSKIMYIDDVLGTWTDNPNGLTARLLHRNHGIKLGAASEAMKLAATHVD